MGARWFRLRRRTRFAIGVPLFVVVGFVLDLIDHAYGRDNSPISFLVSMPIGAILMVLLLADRRK